MGRLGKNKLFRTIGMLAILSLALSACSVQLAGFSSDGFNHISYAGSCNNSTNPSSYLYACTGGVSGEINGMPFQGHLVSCGPGNNIYYLFCQLNGATCQQIATGGEFIAYGVGTLGGVPVNFYLILEKEPGTGGSPGGTAELIIPSIGFSETFPFNNLRLTNSLGNTSPSQCNEGGGGQSSKK